MLHPSMVVSPYCKLTSPMGPHLPGQPLLRRRPTKFNEMEHTWASRSHLKLLRTPLRDAMRTLSWDPYLSDSDRYGSSLKFAWVGFWW